MQGMARQKEKEVWTLMTLWTLDCLSLDLLCMTAKTSSGLRHCFVLGGEGVLFLVAKHDSYMVRLQVGVRVCVLESGTQNKWIRGV